MGAELAVQDAGEVLMVEITEYAKDVLRRNPDKVRELMKRQGRTDEEIVGFMADFPAPEDESGGSLADLLNNMKRDETNGDRN